MMVRNNNVKSPNLQDVLFSNINIQ